jgi:hypothetical protein
MVLTVIGWTAALLCTAIAAWRAGQIAWPAKHARTGRRLWTVALCLPSWISLMLWGGTAIVIFTLLGAVGPLRGGIIGGGAVTAAVLLCRPWTPEGRFALGGHVSHGFTVTGPEIRRRTSGPSGWLRRRLRELRAGGPSVPVTVTVEPGPPAAPFHPSPNGASDMSPKNTKGNGTRPPTNGRVQQPAIRARRTAAAAGTIAVPAEWGQLVASTVDFRAESNVELVEWMVAQVLGIAGWAEAIVEQHEANREEIGVDPVAISVLHDVADAGVACAETMAAAVRQFTDHYELPDAFVDNGGILAHDGSWHQGSPA